MTHALLFVFMLWELFLIIILNASPKPVMPDGSHQILPLIDVKFSYVTFTSIFTLQAL